MKYFIVTLLFLFYFNSSLVAQATEIAHETFLAQGIEEVLFNLGKEAKITTKTTKGSRIIVESSVKISASNPALLKYLIKSGRYQLNTSIEPSTGTMTLSRKKNTNVIVIKGEACEEELEYIVYLPEQIKFANSSIVSAKN